MATSKIGHILSLIGIVTACAYRPAYEGPKPLPPLRCYLLSTDTVPPVVVPDTLILGANQIGSGTWWAAAVKPDRLPGLRDSRRLLASWRPLNRDSVYIEWHLPMTAFGPVGVILAVLTQDSLTGRVAHGSDVIPWGPWVSVKGRAAPCQAGA